MCSLKVILMDPEVGAILFTLRDRQRLMMSARIHRVWLIIQHRRPEDSLALLWLERERRVEVRKARATAAALWHVVQIHEEGINAHALYAVIVAFNVVIVPLIESARAVALLRACLVVDELRKLAVRLRRACHIAHACHDALDNWITQAACILAPRVRRRPDLRLHVCHLRGERWLVRDGERW